MLDVNYSDMTWATEITDNKRAPMMVKVTVNFAPIHDIPLGIDHEGVMRAPAYNVGNVNKTMFGESVYDDEL